MAKKEATLGIDIGTSACKVVLLSTDGGVIGAETVEYGLEQPRPGWVDQDPYAWADGAAHAVRKLMCGHAEVAVCAVGLSGQMHGMTPLGAGDEVLRPAILWNDQRNEAECQAAIDRAGGEAAVRRYTNNDFLVGYTGGKILWLRNHEPDVFRKLRLVLNPKDYIRLLLTGEKATEVSEASGTGLFDVRARAWSVPLLEKLGLDPSLLPRCYESTDVTGQVSARGEDLFGIRRGTPVVGGGGDSVVQTIGSGVIAAGEVETNIGTGGVTAAALDLPVDNIGGGLQVFCNVIPGKWHAMGVAISAGFALNWLRRVFDSGDKSAHRWSFDEIMALAAHSPPGARGLVFLPYLNGERAPHPDPDARGAFVGLTGLHGTSDMARALMEGVAFELYDMYLLLHSAGVEAKVVKASGGGARSPLWRQLQADVFDSDVVTTEGAAEGSAFGAALVAALGVGVVRTPQDAVTLYCGEVTRQSPQAASRARLREMFRVYRGLYPALRSSFQALSRISAQDAVKPHPSNQAASMPCQNIGTSK